MKKLSIIVLIILFALTGCKKEGNSDYGYFTRSIDKGSNEILIEVAKVEKELKDKEIKQNTVSKLENNTKIECACEQNETTGTPIVVDGINTIYGFDNETRILVPEIKGSTKTIKSINNRIKHDILTRIIDDLGYVYNDIDHLDHDDVCVPFDFKYDTTTIDNIIIIHAYSDNKDGKACDLPQSGGGQYSYNYFYDIKNDKELDIAEVAKRLGITDLDESNSYEELKEDPCSAIIIENNKLRIYSKPDICI